MRHPTKPIRSVRGSIKLDLGAGGAGHNGYLTVDNNPLAKPDVSHDLNKFPYPFPDSSVEEIIMSGVMEHLDSPIKVLEELYRISKPGCLWKITVPHYTKTMVNPTHKSGFIKQFWNLVNANHPRRSEKYLELDIDVIKEEYIWFDTNSGFMGILNRIISSILNYNGLLTDRFLCFWFGGIDNIYFEVRVLKGMPYDRDSIEFRKRLFRR